MRLALVLLGLPLAMAAAVVEGTVTEFRTGAPLQGVSVNLGEPNQISRLALTDAHGRFRFEDVPPGRKFIGAYKHRFGRADLLDSPTVEVGIAAIELKLRLVALGAISGRVLDADGRGVAGANVHLVETGWGITVNAQTTTNASGAYLLDNVDPGVYLLEVLPPGDGRPPRQTDGRTWAYQRTFYPSVTDPRLATRILVEPSVERVKTDVTLVAAPVYRVRGRVQDESGAPLATASVSIEPIEEFDDAWPVERIVETQPDGSFEFAGLPDGAWGMRVSHASGSAWRTLRISGAGIDGLEVRPLPRFTLNGTVLAEAPLGKPGWAKVGLVILRGTTARDGGEFGEVYASGAFSIPRMRPGVYHFGPLSGVVEGQYLESIRMGDREVLGEYVELSATPPPVVYQYRLGGGIVRGRVEGGGETTVVMLVSHEPRFRRDFGKQVNCGADGSFELRNIRPGEYEAYAFDGIFQYADFRHLDVPNVVSKGQVLTVRAGEVTTAAPNLLQRSDLLR